MPAFAFKLVAAHHAGAFTRCVTVGACARDDEVFEVKSRGIAPVSVSTFWKAPPPKWMIEKGLASAPPATSDDEKEECARDE